MVRYYGGKNVPGAPGQSSPAVRFDPSQLYFQPGPAYFQNPGYSPFLQDQDRDRFILHDPRSGVAGGNFLGPEATKIRGASPVRQPILPGEQREAVEGVYGSPEPKPMPGSSPLGLPMAAGFNAPFNAGGSLEGAQLAQGQAGDAGALLRDYIGALFNPLGFMRKTQGVANQIQERNKKQEQMINELLDRR